MPFRVAHDGQSRTDSRSICQTRYDGEPQTLHPSDVTTGVTTGFSSGVTTGEGASGADTIRTVAR